jgi:GH35 family endo-1,4-beta-xylanase
VPDGTEVKVVQTESDFRFGCNIFNFDQFGDDRRNAAYRAEFMTGGLFNAATVPFYWGALEPERGRPRFEREASSEPAYWTTHSDKDVAWRRPAPDPVLDFLEANGVSAHGHAIIYARYHPAWVDAKMAQEDRWKLYDRHIAEIAGKYGSRLPQWDIVNESIDINSPASAPTDAHSEQPTNYTFRSFRVAGNAFPAGVKKCINGVYVGENYPAFIAKLVKDGAPIDVIGHQMHIFSDEEVMQVASGQTVHPNYVSWKPADQIAMFKKYDEIGLPIHVS